MNTDNKKISHSSAIAFLCFVLSGAASVSYEMIWLRQAMTYFGVVSPVLSAVISVFMAGLAFGTWFSGRITSSVSPKNAIKYYALVELLIAGYAFIVPMCFKMGYNELLSVSDVQSGTYLLASWGIITVVLLPVSILIGVHITLIDALFARGWNSEK